MMDIAKLIAADPDARPPRLVFGVVTQASPLKVDWTGAGTGTPASKLASYTPGIGHTVAALEQGVVRLVLGNI